jgi:hypothetical protein
VVAGCVLTRAEEKCFEPDALFIEYFVHKKNNKNLFNFDVLNFLYITDIGFIIGLCGLGYTFESW